MKFTLSWLKDHLDTTASLEEISNTLTAIGLEVEEITDRSEELAAFTVAKVLHAEKHPDADKLKVCNVQSNAGELQIVCGAPNAREGIYVALAQNGAKIPSNGLVLKKTKIRGVESNGMMCSADELCIGEDSDGIIELPEAEIGTPIAAVLGLDDPVIEIAITPNRSDALGVRGIARDLATAGLGTLKPLPEANFSGSFDSPVSVSITTEHCQQFIGCYIKGVKNGPSPEWMQTRLKAIGLRPISALVDVTNYVTYDLGRPLHVYDSAKLNGNLTVKAASGREKMHALDDKEYTLAEGMTVIADEKAPVAIGGVIGGLNSGCSDDTTDVFLEVALFTPEEAAKSGRALQLQTDARFRFERGVDVAFVETGAKHAVRLIQELCGGEASNLVHAGDTPKWQRDITLRPARVASLGGVSIARDKIEQILTSLGFTCSADGENFKICPPSWRPDIEGEADLIEEVLRIHGYDHIPTTALPTPTRFMKPALNDRQKTENNARRLLASRGFMECHTWSFLPEAHAKAFGGGTEELKLCNPISADLDSMRPSLLPNLISAAHKNSNRGFDNLALFEVGLTYHGLGADGQKLGAGALRIGHKTHNEYGDNFKVNSNPVDVFDAKTDALAVLSALGVAKFDISTDTPSWCHPGRSGAITLGGKIILGYFGELHPTILKQFDMEGKHAVACELFLDAIPQPKKKKIARPPLEISDFQVVERDFAFLVDEGVTAADVTKSLSKADKKLVKNVTFFDSYQGKGVEPGKKSIAIKVSMQAMDRTLSDEDITAVSKQIVDTAEKSFGGKLRQ